MYLFFDGVSSRGYIGLFDVSQVCISSQYFDIAGNESLKSLGIITCFMRENSITYGEIENIVCVTGPGSFTGIRCISLIVNTLAFTHPHIGLTPINWFDMSDTYPLVKSSSKRDLFVKREKGAIIQIVSNEDIEDFLREKIIYGDSEPERFQKSDFQSVSIDYSGFMADLKLQNEKKLSPLYCKKPNIS